MQEHLTFGRRHQLALAALEVAAQRRVEIGIAAGEQLALAVGEPRAGEQALAARSRLERALDEGQSFRSLQALDENLDLAAARQAHLPGGLVGDAKLHGLGPAAGEDLLGLGDHFAFDAPARHRALKAPIGRDHHLPADGDGRRSPGTDYRRHGDAAVPVEPRSCGLQHIVCLGAAECCVSL